MTCELPNKFCICFSLKKGGRIIASISFLLSFISCFLLIIYLCSDFDEITKEIAGGSPDFELNLQQTSGSAKICAGVLLLLSIVLLLSSVLLVRGITNKSQKQILPFLVVLATSIVFTSIIAILQFERGPFFATLTLIVVFIYFFVCIYSLYKNVDEVDALPTHSY